MGRSVTPTTDEYYGALPILVPKGLGAASFAGQMNQNRLEGFSGDGDYIELPTAAASGVIQYFNSAGASQWTVAKADINALVDEFIGFVFDDNVIYVVAADNATTPDTFYTASINSAGTVTNIGNAAPANDFTTVAGKWSVANTSVGSSMVLRGSVGSGNLFVRQNETAGMEQMEINISNGAIVSDPATLLPSLLRYCAWKTTDDLYLGFTSAATPYISDLTRPALRGMISAAYAPVGVYQNGTKPVQWKGYVCMCQPNSAAASNYSRLFEISVFDAWIKRMYATMGLS